MTRLLEKIAELSVRHRLGVVVATTLVSILMGALIPRIRLDFTPSDLFAKFGNQEQVAREFREQFGNTDNVVLVLMQADRVTDRDVLQAVHDISLGATAQPWAARVDSLTMLPIPQAPGEQEREHASRSIVAALYAAGSIPAQQVRRHVAAARGEPAEPAASTLPELPPPVLAMVTGRGSVQRAVAGDVVTDAEAETLDRVVTGSRLLEGRLVAKDRSVTAIAIYLRPELSRNDELAAVVTALRAQLAAVELPEGARVHVGGLPAIRTEVISRMKADQRILLPASLLVCLVILGFSFRWWPALVLPTLTVLMSAVLLVGGMAAVGESFNIINNIVPLLIIIIGISNSIHLVSRYGEEVRLGRSSRDAAAQMARSMIVACFLTSFTTAVGFGSLVVSRTEVLQRFGVVAGVGVMISWWVTLTFLPAVLSWLTPPASMAPEAKEGWMEDAVGRLTAWVLRHRTPILASTALIFAGSLTLAPRVRIDSAVLDQFDPDDEVYVITKLVEEKLTGVRPLELYLTSPTPGRFEDPAVLNALDGIRSWALRQDGVLGATSTADYLHEVIGLLRGAEQRDAAFSDNGDVERAAAMLSGRERNPLAPWVSDDRTRARVHVGVRDFGARATIELADALQAEASRQLAPFGDIHVELTGDAYSGSRGLEAVIHDFAGSLGLATVIIFLFMAGLFRSLRLAVLSVPPNLLPLVVTLAIMVLADIPLNAATSIIFSISIGMAVDGSIHILARFGEERDRCSTVDEAIVRSARGTGKAIIMTCFSLMLGFGVMLLSGFVPVRLFGQLVAITVLGCLVSTSVVFPALLKAGLPDDPTKTPG